MRGLRHVRNSVLAVLALCTIVALSSCSKKDVVSDEPVMNPSDLSGAAAPTDSGAEAIAGDTSGAAASAGDVGAAAAELQTVYFAFDSYALTSDGRNALKSNADWMKANPGARVQIEGHCDERGTNEYNMALGDRRANAAKSYLARMGVDSSKMETLSYGEERPSDPGHDESAWSRNRRAVFVILSQ